MTPPLRHSAPVRAIVMDALEQGGANAPVHDFSALRGSAPEGAFRLQEQVEHDTPLDALVVNRRTDVVVVSLHGALSRASTELPRFERLRTLLAHDVSTIFFGDPTLHLSAEIQLAWYTGWAGVDVHSLIASRTEQIAAAIGAKTIIFTGSSGGGFAGSSHLRV